VIDIVSHDQNTICSIPVEKASEILKHANGTNVVGIDEAQFFDNEIITVCSQLANSGTRVIIAGLDIDFKGIPFGPMPYLCAIAEDVFKTRAICVRCGSLAYISHRLIDDHSQIRLGEKNLYEPLCRTCNNDSINQKPSSTC
jgi:thymidine kinase